MKILYLGWIGANNLGDDLMFNIFKEYIAKEKGDDYSIDGLFPNPNYNNFNNYDLVCLGGGSILLKGFINVLYNAIKAGKKVIIWGSAFDSDLSLEYIDRIENSSLPIYIYSDTTEFQLNEISKKALFFGVRGSLTYNILKNSYVDMNNIVISGDPGFLLEESDESKAKFEKDDNVVGINFGTSNNYIYGKNENYVEEELVKICNTLLDEGYKLYLFALWDRDLDFISHLYSQLNKHENVILDLDIHDAKDFVSIIKNCVFTINLKLHANVISAVANVPFISLGYRVKSYELLKSLDLENLNIFTNEKKLEEKILNKIEFINKNSDSIKKTLIKKINEYKEIHYKLLSKI